MEGEVRSEVRGDGKRSEVQKIRARRFPVSSDSKVAGTRGNRGVARKSQYRQPEEQGQDVIVSGRGGNPGMESAGKVFSHGGLRDARWPLSGC